MGTVSHKLSLPFHLYHSQDSAESIPYNSVGFETVSYWWGFDFFTLNKKTQTICY